MDKKKQVALIRREPFALARRAEQKEEFITAVVDIFEMPDAFIVKLDMPGSSKDGMKITVESGVLTVQGAFKSLHRERVMTPTRERVTLSYLREFNLGEGVEADRIEAEFEDGVLTLMIPKSDDYKARQIPIS